MNDRVFIRHPDQPHHNGYVYRTAFDNLWSKKGYVIEADDTDLSPAVEAVYGDADWVDPDRIVAADTPAPQPTEEDEVARLQGILAAHGVKVDRRWGLKRLRTEAATLEDSR